MRSESTQKRPRIGRDAKVTPLNSNEQATRIREAVSRRAYEIFERRGGTPLHDSDDWRQAESELVRPCCCGHMTLDGNLWLSTDPSCFEEGTIEIWVAPRRMTLCGNPRIGSKSSELREQNADTIYRVINLPLEIDPEGVTTRFSGPSLEILMRKAQAKPMPAMAAVA